jgi:hypothetical protein
MTRTMMMMRTMVPIPMYTACSFSGPACLRVQAASTGDLVDAVDDAVVHEPLQTRPR